MLQSAGPNGAAGAASALSFLQFAFLIPVIFTVIGWIVVSNQNDRRVRRQEIRDQVKELRERCDSAVEAAGIYWCSGVGVERGAAAIKLKAAFPALTRILRTMNAAGLPFDRWDLLADFRQAATGADFEVKGRRRRPSDQEKVLDAARAADDLVETVDDAYFTKFPTRGQRRWLPSMALVSVFGLSGDAPKA